MSAKKTLLASTVGSLLALAAAETSLAAEDANTEKCYGIAKAGKNDCAGAKHACAGQSTESKSPTEWIKLPKGTCERIVGGSLGPPSKK